MIKTRDMIILAIIACVSLLISLSTFNRSELLEGYGVKSILRNSSIRFDAIETIDIHRDGIHLYFEKVDGVWWQHVPFPMRMDHSSMLMLIETAQDVQVLGELPEGEQLEGLGLGDEANKITFSDAITTVTIRLGRETLGGRAYAMLDDGNIMLVDQTLHNRAVEMDHQLWRDIRLFPDFAIDGVRIQRDVDGDRLLLERKSGRWEMREPVRSRVEQEVLKAWVGELAAAKISSFVIDQPTDLSMFGLDSPAAIFEVGDRQGSAIIAFVGGRVSAGAQDRYMMIAGQPAIFTMKWETLSQLFPMAELLIDSTGSSVSRFDVKQVIIRSKQNETILQRDLDNWIYALSGKDVVDTEAVDMLLKWILDTKPLSIAIGQYPMENEFATVTFVGYDLSPIDSIRIAKTLDSEWILENGDNVLRLHSSESGDVLVPFIN